MSETAAQAAYEALHQSIGRRQPGHIWIAWPAVNEINDGIPGEPLREDMEAAASAAIGHAAGELATLRELLDAQAKLWRHYAARDVKDDQADDAAREIYDECAVVLEGILRTHQTPAAQAPGQQETNQEGTQ